MNVYSVLSICKSKFRDSINYKTDKSNAYLKIIMIIYFVLREINCYIKLFCA